MKEVGSSALRGGISIIWRNNVAPLYFSKQYFFQAKVQKTMIKIFNMSWCLNLFQVHIVTLGMVSYFYCYYHVTQLSFQLFVKPFRYNSYIQKKMISRCIEVKKYVSIKRKRLIKGKFRNVQQRRLNIKRQINKLICKRQKYVRISTLTTIINFTNKQILPQQKILKKKRVLKKNTIQMLRKITVRMKVRIMLDRRLTKALERPTRCFIRPVTMIFKKSVKFIEMLYNVYVKIPFLHYDLRFIDALTVVFMTLRFRDPNGLVFYLCREMHYTRTHFMLLRIVRTLVSTFKLIYPVIFTAFRIIVRGPINKHARRKQFMYLTGKLSRSELTKPIVYKMFYTVTLFGVLGVRVWVL
jgi:hypothetical protein